MIAGAIQLDLVSGGGDVTLSAADIESLSRMPREKIGTVVRMASGELWTVQQSVEEILSACHIAQLAWATVTPEGLEN